MPSSSCVRARKRRYFFKSYTGWRYEDKVKPVVNALATLESDFPHFVLHDGKGVPRFTLFYGFHRGFLNIYAVQRERTQYRRNADGTWLWDAVKETEKSKLFQRRLGGIHPAEFLLAAFLRSNRRKVLSGARVRLVLPVSRGGHEDLTAVRNALALRDRFFKRTPIETYRYLDEAFYPLNLEKKRVRDILGLDKKRRA